MSLGVLVDDAGRDGKGLFGWASGGPAGGRRVGAAPRVAAHLAPNSSTAHSHITHAQIFNTQQRAVKPARSRAQQSGAPPRAACTCGRSTGRSARCTWLCHRLSLPRRRRASRAPWGDASTVSSGRDGQGHHVHDHAHEVTVVHLLGEARTVSGREIRGAHFPCVGRRAASCGLQAYLCPTITYTSS
jgi:hypothetical protein